MVNLHKVHGFSYTLLCPVSMSRVVVMQKDDCDCAADLTEKLGPAVWHITIWIIEDSII
jgi:hypothetical protein